jgi:predicted dehydrogenase
MNGLPPVNVGLIGCGIVAQRGHLPGLRTLPTARLVALSDSDPERLRRVADQHSIESRYPDYRSLLEDPEVEAVAVCVPASLHVEMGVAALDAGKHLLIEKPLALSLDESDRLIHCAAGSSCKATVGFNLRWHRLVREARSLLRGGALGRLELARSVLTSGTQFGDEVPAWRARRATGGGEFLETAIHHIDLWRSLFEAEVEEISAVGRSERWDDETVALLLRLDNGVLASSVFSTLTTDDHRFEIWGRAGTLSVSLLGFGDLSFTLTGQTSGILRGRLERMNRTIRTFPSRARRALQGGDSVLSYREEWRHFIQCIREDLTPECSLEDGRRALQVALSAIESVSGGAPVRVARPPTD